METIASRANARIKYAARLATDTAFRREEGCFFAEGAKLCPELCRGAAARQLFFTEAALRRQPALEALPGEHFLVEPPVAQRLAGTNTTQGVFGVFETPVSTWEQVRPGGRYLALEGVQDPGNVGTLIRSAAAFGFSAVLLGPGCADPFSPKTLRAAMGAAVQLPLIAVGPLPGAVGRLREMGIHCLAAALRDARPLSSVPRANGGGLCVVVGSEGQGLSDETITACNAAVRIPMTDRVESLNAGVAGSVLLWHFGEIEQ